tara:strand:+ start:817 stop:1035 length:219 start_codon:yes stop_codon:yes gene_type:complete
MKTNIIRKEQIYSSIDLLKNKRNEFDKKIEEMTDYENNGAIYDKDEIEGMFGRRVGLSHAIKILEKQAGEIK